MADLRIHPSQLKGCLSIPSSKSQTLRAILFASLAKGKSRIEKVLQSPDTQAMICAMRMLGAEIEEEEDALAIRGCAGKLCAPEDVIQCGNSGIVLRFVGALAGIISDYTILTGDVSIRSNRIVQPLLDGLQQLGAFAVSSRNNGYAPIVIKGPFTKKNAAIDGSDSQPVSGLLIAGAFNENPLDLQVKNPGEKAWVDLTLDWFRRLGIPYKARAYQFYQMQGNASIEGFYYQVPGDLSSAAFPIAAALLTHSELLLENVDINDMQGDKEVISLFEKMGACFTYEAQSRTLAISRGNQLQGIRIDINNMIDALPILSVVGCFAAGRTELYNGAIARAKESDRISAMAQELRKMGAAIEEQPDGLIIHPKPLKGAHVFSHRDHRVAMSLSVAAMSASGSSVINDTGCIAKTYPCFAAQFRSAGALIEE